MQVAALYASMRRDVVALLNTCLHVSGLGWPLCVAGRGGGSGHGVGVLMLTSVLGLESPQLAHLLPSPPPPGPFLRKYSKCLGAAVVQAGWHIHTPMGVTLEEVGPEGVLAMLSTVPPQVCWTEGGLWVAPRWACHVHVGAQAF